MFPAEHRYDVRTDYGPVLQRHSYGLGGPYLLSDDATPANGMVRPYSRHASDRGWSGSPLEASTRCQ